MDLKIAELFGICEECPEQATNLVQDFDRIANPKTMLYTFQPHGEIHRFCAVHTRVSKYFDVDEVAVDASMRLKGRDPREKAVQNELEC